MNNEKEVCVADIMHKGLITIPEHATVKEAAARMSENRVSALVAVRDKMAKGIVTDRDIVVRVVASGKDQSLVLVKDIMSSPIVAIAPDVSINDAALMMVKHRIKKLPVVDKSGKLMGMLTYSDLINTYPGYVDMLKGLLKVHMGEEATL